MKDRFPHPLFLETYHRESQERYLLAIVDPEAGNITFLSECLPNFFLGAQGLHSEDASLSRFLDHLKKYVVKKD